MGLVRDLIGAGVFGGGAQKFAGGGGGRKKRADLTKDDAVSGTASVSGDFGGEYTGDDEAKRPNGKRSNGKNRD